MEQTDKKLKIQDIARLAGVSTATVSRALHSPHLLREETLQHVMDVIRSNRYIYNVVAGDFSRQRSSILGAFVPWELTGGKINATLVALQQVINAHGYPLLINVTQADPQIERTQIIRAQERALAGLVFVGCTPPNEELVEELRASGTACIFVWDTFPDTDRCYVGFDNAAAAASMARYLISLGHERIAFMGAQQSTVTRVSKCAEGVRTALREVAIPCRPEYFVEYPSGLQHGRNGMYHLLALPQPPTAVICANDMMAIGALAVCREAGLRVPGDMSIAGFDDIDLAAYTVPALTTVRAPSLEMGQMAGRCLLDMVRSGERGVSQHILPTTLLIRESCGPPA